ncbi:MAG: DUF4390 domain-containing protein [Gammaproteobacteria bacterium PRO9]|nr:DUF4390 domain-containing protein [Gammaproteobacteria bacterium PRO9]
MNPAWNSATHRQPSGARRSVFGAAGPRGLAVVLVAVMTGLGASLMPTSVHAQETGLEIRNADTRLDNGVWYLDARIDYRLNRETLEALQSGIPLTFELQVEVVELRRWWLNADVASLRQQFELSWQPLSRGYLVRNKNSGDQRTHSTLFAALNDLGRVTDLPLIDGALIDRDRDYEVSLRAVLDQQQLPGPLRMLAFWDDDFTLESDWYRWRLRQPATATPATAPTTAPATAPAANTPEPQPAVPDPEPSP